jgi:hypothetical protein
MGTGGLPNKKPLAGPFGIFAGLAANRVGPGGPDGAEACQQLTGQACMQ